MKQVWDRTWRTYVRISMPVDQDCWLLYCDATIEEQIYRMKVEPPSRTCHPKEQIVHALREFARYIELSAQQDKPGRQKSKKG